jgi:hypothetical protein
MLVASQSPRYRWTLSWLKCPMADKVGLSPDVRFSGGWMSAADILLNRSPRRRRSTGTSSDRVAPLEVQRSRSHVYELFCSILTMVATWGGQCNHSRNVLVQFEASSMNIFVVVLQVMACAKSAHGTTCPCLRSTRRSAWSRKRALLWILGLGHGWACRQWTCDLKHAKTKFITSLSTQALASLSNCPMGVLLRKATKLCKTLERATSWHSPLGLPYWP